MSYHRRTTWQWARIIVTVSAFVIAAALLIAGANGYMFNPVTKTFQSTGEIHLKFSQVPLTVTLDKNPPVEAKNADLSFANLFAGYYTVTATKPNYFAWSNTSYINTGQAVSYPYVLLFLSHPNVKEATSDERLSLATNNLNTGQSSLIDVRGNELWLKPIVSTYPLQNFSDSFSLVGRYSNPIIQAVIYPDKAHVALQIGNEIRIIDWDGSNDTVLATLSSDAKANFMFTDSGKTLLYQDGDKDYHRPLYE